MRYLKWAEGRATEQELFYELDDEAVLLMLRRAIDIRGRQPINDHIRHYSKGTKALSNIEATADIFGFDFSETSLLGLCAHKGEWFKSQSFFENIAADIVDPRFEKAIEGFQARIQNLFRLAHTN